MDQPVPVVDPGCYGFAEPGMICIVDASRTDPDREWSLKELSRGPADVSIMSLRGRAPGDPTLFRTGCALVCRRGLRC